MILLVCYTWPLYFHVSLWVIYVSWKSTTLLYRKFYILLTSFLSIEPSEYLLQNICYINEHLNMILAASCILWQSRKLQENGWQPRWFQRDCKDGSFRYVGGYWEAREQGKWDRCPNIFGEISEGPNSFENSWFLKRYLTLSLFFLCDCSDKLFFYCLVCFWISIVSEEVW